MKKWIVVNVETKEVETSQIFNVEDEAEEYIRHQKNAIDLVVASTEIEF